MLKTCICLSPILFRILRNVFYFVFLVCQEHVSSGVNVNFRLKLTTCFHFHKLKIQLNHPFSCCMLHVLAFHSNHEPRSFLVKKTLSFLSLFFSSSTDAEWVQLPLNCARFFGSRFPIMLIANTLYRNRNTTIITCRYYNLQCEHITPS